VAINDVLQIKVARHDANFKCFGPRDTGNLISVYIHCAVPPHSVGIVILASVDGR